MINRIYNPLARILYTDLDLKNIDAGGTQEPAPTPPTPITYLTNWKIVGNSEVHGNEIWSCGEYSPVDGKYHILVQPQGGSIADIALTEPLRKVGDVADTIEFANGVAIVTRNIQSMPLKNLTFTYNANENRLSFDASYLRNGSFVSIAYISNSVRNMLTTEYEWTTWASAAVDVTKDMKIMMSSSGDIKIRDLRYDNTTDFYAHIDNMALLFRLATPTTELVDAPQIEEADSYTCEISQGGKAVSWSSFTPNYLAEAAVASVTVVSNISEYTKAIVDAEDKILYGLKTNGTEYTPDLTGDTITIGSITYDAQFIVDIVKATL